MDDQDSDDSGLNDVYLDDGDDGAAHDVVEVEDEEDDDEGNAEAITDDADVVLSRHTGSVFCCDLEPTSCQVAVSGGEDDRAFVWGTTDGELLFECTDHKDSVTCCGFSNDGKLLATGDMSGIVQVWNVEDKSKIWSNETSDLLWLRWHAGDPRVLLAGTADGDLWMWRMPTGECHIFPGHGAANECAALLPDGRRLAAGYGDGIVRIWDLKTKSTRHSFQGDGVAHKGGVICIDCYGDDALVITGSVDGTAKLMNATSGKVLSTLNCTTPDDKESPNSVESVGFCSSLPVFATGTLRGRLDVWDIPTQVKRQECKQEAGIVRLIWDRTSPLLYTAGMDGVLRLWDARTGNMTSQWTGHSDNILDAVLSRDGSTLLTSSDDKTCRLFHVKKPDR